MFSELLQARVEPYTKLSATQLARLQEHYELLTRWNRILNLTSVRTIEESVERHYCESLFAALYLPQDPISIADIGSGGGFPGLPIAIVRPQAAIALVESHQRKAAFLKEASRDLRNVRVIAKRAEDVHERFDWGVSRAVRLADIAGALSRHAPNVALLVGAADKLEMPGFAWEDPIRLPWGVARYLWIGHANGE